MADHPELSAANRTQLELIAAAYGESSVVGFGNTPPEDLYLTIDPIHTVTIKTGHVAERIKVDAIFGDQDVLLRQGTTARSVGYVGLRVTKLTIGVEELGSLRRGVTLAMLEHPEKEYGYSEIADISASLGATNPGEYTNRLLRNWWNHRLLVGTHQLIIPIDRRRQVNPLLEISFKSVEGHPEAAE